MSFVSLYLAAMLSGFALIVVGYFAPALGLAFLTPIATVLMTIGVIAVIVFAIALIYHGSRSLLKRHFN